MRRERVRMMISLDKEVCEQADKIAREMGIRRSELITMMLKNLIKAEGLPLASWIEGIFEDIVNTARKKTATKSKV